MALWKYLDEQVKITTTTGNIFTGLADIYHYPEDNENGIASLTVELVDGTLIGFDENEIAHIEIFNLAEATG